MFDELVELLYSKWCDSENYITQSSLEKEAYYKSNGRIEGITGKKVYHDIYDYIVSIAVDAEHTGFEAGLKYGIGLVQSVKEGGAV